MTFVQPITRSILVPMVDAIAPGGGAAISLSYDIVSEVTISAPDDYAGIYIVNGNDVTVGPHVLVQPRVEGNFAVGETLSVVSGLYAHGVIGGEPNVAIAWIRGATPITGETGPEHVVTSADLIEGLTVQVTATNGDGSSVLDVDLGSPSVAAPMVTGPLADQNLTFGSGDHVVDGSSAFAGNGLSYTVQGASASIDQATGVVNHATNTLHDNVTVIVTATNEGGSAQVSYALSVADQAPALIGSLLDQSFDVATGDQIYDASVAFSGTNLVFSVVGAGVSVDPGTGVVTHDTSIPRGASAVTVTASNSEGAVSTGYSQNVSPFAPTVEGNISDQFWDEGSGTQTIDASTLFAGTGLTYSVVGFGSTIDPESGIVSHITETVHSNATITVTATNVSGAATVEYETNVRRIAPAVVGAIEDRSYSVGSGAQTVDASSAFFGSNLTYSVSGSDVSVDTQTGVVTHDTGSAASGLAITVTAANEAGAAAASYSVTILENGYSVVDSISEIDVAISDNDNGTHTITITGLDADYTSYSPVIVQDADLSSGLPICVVPSPITEGPVDTFAAKPGLWISPSTDPASFAVEWFVNDSGTGDTDFSYTNAAKAAIELRETATNFAGSVTKDSTARTAVYSMRNDVDNGDAVAWYNPEIGITLDTELLDVWADQSGNNFDLVEVAGITRPRWDNVKVCSDHSGVPKGLRASSGSPLVDIMQANGSFVIFAVIDVSHRFAGDWRYAVTETASDSVVDVVGIGMHDSNSSHFALQVHMNGTGYLSSALPYGDYSGKMLVELEISDRDVWLRLNGNTIVTQLSAPEAHFSSKAASRLNIGGRLSSAGSIQAPWKDNIYEVFVTENTAAASVIAVRSELKTKHGIS